MPPVNQLSQEFKARGLEVLLVDVREDAALVRRIVAERGYVARVLLDASGDVAGRDYGVFGTPTAYVIDRQGRLLARLVGSAAWSGPAARQVLEAVLALP